MAYYKVSELLDCLNDYASQDIEFVELSILDAPDDDEEDCSNTLYVSGIINEIESIDEMIDSVEPFQ